MLACLLWNVHSLNNKIFDVLSYLEDNNIDIFFATETWLNDNTNVQTSLTSECSTYNIFHIPRKTRGGGVAIFAQTSLQCKQINCPLFESLEHIIITIGKKPKTRLVCVYRRDCISFTVFADEFTDFIVYISEVRVDGFEKLSDHLPVLFNLQLQSPKTKHNIPTTKLSRQINNIDIDFFKMDIGTSLKCVLEDPESHSFFDLQGMFSDALSHVLDEHAPLKRCKITYDPRPEWMDHEYVVARTLRRKLEKISKRTQDEDDHFRYCRQRDWCSTLADHKHRDYYSSLITERSGDQKALFQVCEKLLGSSDPSPLPTLPDPTALPDDFNTFFVEKVDKIQKSILENADIIDIQNNDLNDIIDFKNNKNIPLSSYSNNKQDSLGVSQAVDSPQAVGNNKSAFLDEFQPTTVAELREVIKEAGIKTCSLDPLPASLLKLCTEEVLPSLEVLVNSSLRSGSVEGLKEAVVRPLLKKAGLDPDNFANFRPISNTSFVSKIIERIVHRRINTHMDQNGLHSNTQFGYKKNHGTDTLLVHFIDSLMVAVDKGLGVVVVLIDLSAAFDTVNHDVLLRILGQEIGLRGTALKWFRSFLTCLLHFTSSLASPKDLSLGQSSSTSTRDPYPEFSCHQASLLLAMLMTTVDPVPLLTPLSMIFSSIRFLTVCPGLSLGWTCIL